MFDRTLSTPHHECLGQFIVIFVLKVLRTRVQAITRGIIPQANVTGKRVGHVSLCATQLSFARPCLLQSPTIPARGTLCAHLVTCHSFQSVTSCQFAPSTWILGTHIFAKIACVVFLDPKLLGTSGSLVKTVVSHPLAPIDAGAITSMHQ